MRFITVEEFMHQYSISPENLNYLAQDYGIVPFKFGQQTLVRISDLEFHISNEIMLSEMKAGLHGPYEEPKKHR